MRGWSGCRALVLGLGLLGMNGLTGLQAQEKEDPERNYVEEVTITYTTPQGQTSTITQCATSRISSTDACNCAIQLAMYGVPAGSTTSIPPCVPPTGPMPFCQSCFGLPIGPSPAIAATPCSRWVVRVMGLTRRDGCLDCDKRRDCITAVGVGCSYSEAVQNACRSLRYTACLCGRGGLRRSYRPQVVLRPDASCCP